LHEVEAGHEAGQSALERSGQVLPEASASDSSAARPRPAS
jgi:hypothetical protein